MKKNLIGIDIGGTKCSVIYGCINNGSLEIVEKIKFQTSTAKRTLDDIMVQTEKLMSKHFLSKVNLSAIGISCGGPLDSKNGLIMNPPNLIGWDNIPIVEILSKRFFVNVGIQNDANACALAEWKFGAGKGSKNMIFMTFGTGLGAGLILGGRLYSGTNDNAGEVGHLRLSEFGPVGYGKSGSFEGFCSGNGIAQMARIKALEKIQMGEKVGFCPSIDELSLITAKSVAEAAFKGDDLAIEVFKISGKYLGRGLSILIDILNPDRIVIGGIYTRCEELLKLYTLNAIKKEALEVAAVKCEIVPALLGEEIGDYAALSVAANIE